MALYNIFRVVELCRSKLDIDCDDSFIAYHVFEQIRRTGGLETLETVRDDSQLNIILENIKLDYEAYIDNIEKELQLNEKPFKINKLLEAIATSQKHNPNIHVTNYKAFLDTNEIMDNY